MSCISGKSSCNEKCRPPAQLIWMQGNASLQGHDRRTGRQLVGFSNLIRGDDSGNEENHVLDWKESEEDGRRRVIAPSTAAARIPCRGESSIVEPDKSLLGFVLRVDSPFAERCGGRMTMRCEETSRRRGGGAMRSRPRAAWMR